MAPNIEFIDLNEGGRPPTPNRNRGIPPQPPNHARPPQGGGPPPRVIHAAPHPADMRHVQLQAPQPQLLHYHHPPLVHQHDPPVRIQDIRKERLTPDEAREELSDYFIYRFEPAQRANDDFDDGDDLERRSKWESCLVMEVRGVSKKEAARQVRHLSSTPYSLGEKKASLSGVQQRQIEKILEELQARDHQYFQTNLVQIDHQLRTIVKPKHDKHYHKHGAKHVKDYRQLSLFRDPKHHKRSSSSKEKKKPKQQERVSLTAYYKRSPRPDLDALAFYRQREARNHRLLQPQPPPPLVPPPEAIHHQHHQQQQHHQHGADGGQARAGGGGGGGNGGGGGGWNGNKGQGGGKNGGAVVTVMHPDDRKRGGGGRGHSRSPPSSPYTGSSHSDNSIFSADDDMSTITSNSSSSFRGPQRRGSFHRHHPRKDRQYRLEGPAYYGLRQSNRPLRGQAHEVHRISDELHRPPLMPPPVPQLAQPVVDIERIKNSAFEAGRAEGRADARADVEVIADKIAMATVSAVQQPPLRLPPRRLQRRPSIRLVPAGDVSPRVEETLEELEQLDLRDQALQEARYTLPAGSGRRRYPRREDVWEEEHRQPRRRPLDEAMEYIRRTDAHADIPFLDNPFAPMPDERRRPDPYHADFRRHDDF